MFRRIAVIQKPNSLKLAQVICRPLKRHLETPRKKTNAHVHVRYFVLVGHNLNIDYVVVKNKPDFIFGQKKESKTYKWRSLLRRGGLSRHKYSARIRKHASMFSLTRLRYFPPRGPCAGYGRPSRPFGLRSPLKGTIATKRHSRKWQEA